MVWFNKFFNKEKLKGTQQRSGNFQKQELTGVMQTVVEETILATAYWLIGFVNNSLENRAASQAQPEEKPTPSSTNSSEELLPKVINLMEQFNERNQAIAALEARVCTAERLLRENVASEQSRQIASEAVTALENRLVEVEALLKDFESPESSNPSDKNTAALEARIADLEKLLGRYSVVPKLIEQDRRIIAALQQRLAALEVSGNGNHHSDREIFNANVI